MRITFFAPTFVGYLGWPEALYARGLAHALAHAGHTVRALEERRNRHMTQTLERAGATPAREFFTAFQALQYTTYEPVRGARLTEWTARELALVDVAVVTQGTAPDLIDQIAAISREGLLRVYLTFEQGNCISEAAHALDAIFAPSSNAAGFHVPTTVDPRDAALAASLGLQVVSDDPEHVVGAFVAAVGSARSGKTHYTPWANHASN